MEGRWKMKKIDYEEYAKSHRFYGISRFPREIDWIILTLKNEFNEINFLDIGAGDGDFIESLIDKYSLNFFVSDISKIRVDRMKSILGKRIKNYFVDDICNSKIKSNYFEFIYSDQVIEHVNSDLKMVKEIKRILKKGGKFIVSSVYKKRWAWYFYRYNGKWVLDPTHIREYSSPLEFRRIFEEEGLKLEVIRTEKIYYPLIDPFLRLFNINRLKYLKFFRRIKIRIPGYYKIIVIGCKI